MKTKQKVLKGTKRYFKAKGASARGLIYNKFKKINKV